MLRRLLAGVFLSLLTGAALAQPIPLINGRQSPHPGPSPAKTAAGPSYTGPGDIVSGSSAWYGLRGYSGAVAATGTQKAINVRRASDNATTDVLILASGDLNTASAATFCAATTCFVTEWYDQSSHNVHTLQAVAAAQPQLIFSCIGALPCVQFSNANTQLAGGALGSTPQPWTMTAVANVASSGNQSTMIATSGSFNNRLMYFVTNTPAGYAGASILSATGSSDAWHSLQFMANGAASTLNFDGTVTTGTTGVNDLTANGSAVWLGGDGFTLAPVSLAEAGIWPAAFSVPNRTAMQANSKAYWGTP